MEYDDAFSIGYADVPVFYGSKSFYYFPEEQSWPADKYLEVDYVFENAPKV